MGRKLKTLTLSPAHIARVFRAVADSGPPASMVLETDEGYAEWVKTIMRSHPAPDQPTRLFAYGSLIWKPELEHVGEAIAVARGWHRAFCFQMPRFRGTPELPGLMMALDRGGQCKGVLYELRLGDIESQLDKLFRREFTTKPVNSMPRWIKVDTEAGQLNSLTFVMNRSSPLYVGRLTLQEVASVLSQCCGHWGTGAEYLRNTVEHLEARGIHDSRLWELQGLVAEQIERQWPQ